jgi:hypothetical protein
MNVDWKKIDGDGFESLVHAILYAENNNVILFGRPGKDSGQDAKSADGKIVYQAKYRKDSGSIVELAGNELKKIKEYRQESHNNYQHWKDVEKWVLVTNVKTNPNDVIMWNSEVISKFRDNDINVEYWSGETLEQKLYANQHIYRVFFENENRCFLGLKEAYNLLTSGRLSESYECPMVGRDEELSTVLDFVQNGNSPFYSVVGPGGIGKTRLLYEALIKLEEKGIRVFWGLTSALSVSDTWFKSLNSSVKTCIVIDDISDEHLIRRLLEQSFTEERKNWKFLLAYRPEDSQKILGQNSLHLFFSKEKRLELSLLPQPLFQNSPDVIDFSDIQQQKTNNDANGCTQRPTTKDIAVGLKSLLPNVDEGTLAKIFEYSGGNPGWLWLVIEYLKTKNPLLQNTEDLTREYLKSVMSVFSGIEQTDAITLLRWIALWSVCECSFDSVEMLFLREQGIASNIENLLDKLVEQKLIHRFGIDSRKYEINPTIFREAILSLWLFKPNNDSSKDTSEYSISADGLNIVNKIISNEIPFADKVLQSLATLSITRLTKNKRYSFVSPILETFDTILNNEDINAHRVITIINLIEKIGSADIERSLEILDKIVKKTNIISTKIESFWGENEITYEDCIKNIPWISFNFATNISDDASSCRLFDLFCQLASKEDEEEKTNIFTRGKRPSELLKRILINPQISDIIKKEALNRAEKFLGNIDNNNTPISFIRSIVSTLVSPKRETIKYANHTVYFSQMFLSDSGKAWESLVALRHKIFTYLENHSDSIWIWEVLERSHTELRYHWKQQEQSDEKLSGYKNILLNDLKKTKSILENRTPLSPTEYFAARKIWDLYIHHTKIDDDLTIIATECEKIKSDTSQWQFDALFSFDFDSEKRKNAIQSVVSNLKTAENIHLFENFFQSASDYLKSLKKDDLSFSMVIGEIADHFLNEFDPISQQDNQDNIVSKYVRKYVSSNIAEGSFLTAKWFSLMLIKGWIKKTKKSQTFSIDKLIELFPNDTCKYLYAIYQKSFKESLGELTQEELDAILARKHDFIPIHLALLSGMFAGVNWNKVTAVIEEYLQNETDTKEQNSILLVFIKAVYYSTKWNKWKCCRNEILWIVNTISIYDANGSILESSELEALIDNEESASLSDLLKFTESRIQLANEKLSNDIYLERGILHWLTPTQIRESEVEDFKKLCSFVIEVSVLFCHYWLPKIIVQIENSEKYLIQFIEEYSLQQGREKQLDSLCSISRLVSAFYGKNTFVTILDAICRKIQNIEPRPTRKERETIFGYLTPHETPAMINQIGEVNEYYNEQIKLAEQMLNSTQADNSINSITLKFLQWNVDRTKINFKHEQGLMEELDNGSF